jgi:hypothetical protein
MFVFGELAQKLKAFDFEKAASVSLNDKVIHDLIEEKVKDRLYTGYDSDMQKMQTDRSKQQGTTAYALRTMAIKSIINQPILRVTLFYLGDFYPDINIVNDFSSLKIDSDFEKKYGHMYKNFTTSYRSKKEFEEKVLDLTEYEKEFFIDKIIIKSIKQQLKNELRV